METTGRYRGHPPSPGTSSQPSAGPEKLPGIRHVIAVGSGKGGVGKFHGQRESRGRTRHVRPAQTIARDRRLSGKRRAH